MEIFWSLNVHSFIYSTVEHPLCARHCLSSWECSSAHNQQNSIFLELMSSSPVCGLRSNPASHPLGKSSVSGQDPDIWAGPAFVLLRQGHLLLHGAAQYTAQLLNYSERAVGAQVCLPPLWTGSSSRTGSLSFFYLSLNLQPQPEFLAGYRHFVNVCQPKSVIALWLQNRIFVLLSYNSL